MLENHQAANPRKIRANGRMPWGFQLGFAQQTWEPTINGTWGDAIDLYRAKKKVMEVQTLRFKPRPGDLSQCHGDFNGNHWKHGI
jgi:hypothetical protein